MFRLQIGLLVMTCIWAFCGAWAQPYRVEGVVLDELQNPLVDATVVLAFDNGLLMDTKTLVDGSFAFHDLPAGEATCYVKLSPGYQPLSPACARYRIKTQDMPFLDFSINTTTTGVVVTFGSPTGGGTPSIDASPNHEAMVHLILSGLDDYLIKFPTKIVITGHWSVPALGGFPIATLAVGINGHLGFSESVIHKQPQINGRIQYIIQSTGNHVLDQDGPIATLHLQTPPQNGELAEDGTPMFFCMESVLVYSGEGVIDIKSNLGWQGILDP